MEKRIIDLHCDTIMACHFSKATLKSEELHINIEKLIEGGSMMQAFSLFIPTDGKVGRDGKTLPWDIYNGMVETFYKELNNNSDTLKLALTYHDIIKNKEDGYISALLTVEDGIAIDGEMERLEKMYKDGVRMLALTWNFENSIGYPNSLDPISHMKGLKPFGFDVVHRMNELGMIIDVSHLSEGGFNDVANNSKKPFVASHSSARALRNHQRNLTDDQLKTLANHGGVVGVNFCSAFLSEDLRNTYAKDIVNHLLYMKNVAGIDTLSFGSDFDGIESIMDFRDYAGFPIILNLLEKEFTDDEIEKICNKNFLRVMKDI